MKQIIAWKKARRMVDGEDRPVIVKLLLDPNVKVICGQLATAYKGSTVRAALSDGRRVGLHASELKLRAPYVTTLGFFTVRGEPLPDSTRVFAAWDPEVRYVVGRKTYSREEYSPRDKAFDHDPLNVCSSGIHFFLSRRNAIEYAR